MINNIYADFSENFMCIPVIKGSKNQIVKNLLVLRKHIVSSSNARR